MGSRINQADLLRVNVWSFGKNESGEWINWGDYLGIARVAVWPEPFIEKMKVITTIGYALVNCNSGTGTIFAPYVTSR